MSAVQQFYPQSKLTSKDLENLRQSFITPEIASEANIYRVDSIEGSSIVGRSNNGSYDGLIFPYRYPGNSNARDYRLRRDTPDIEYDKNGQPKEKAKYLGSPGSRNKFYFPPSIPLDAYKNAAIDIVITEGEKKTLALYRLGLEKQLNWLPIGLSGVWTWKGTIGKTDAPFGGKQEIKGVISDFDFIEWIGRKVYIVFDRNTHTNESIKVARQELAKELIGRGAKVILVDIPEELSINGIDDFLFNYGVEKGLSLFQQAEDNQEANIERKKIVPNSQVAPILEKYFQNKLAWDCISKEWLSYNPQGIWEKVQEEQIEAIIKDQLNRILPKVFNWNGGFSWSYLNGVIKMLRADIAVANWQEKADLLPMLNGVLHLPTMKLLAHNPIYYLRWQLPYNYNPEATCPKIQQWLLETAKNDNDVAGLLRAYLKAVVTGKTDLQRYLELLGQASTGKSTYIKLAMALVGLQNVFATELKALEQNRFETSNLYGKKLVVVTDSERYGGSVSTLKALVGQDLLRFEKKFENARNGFTCGAMLIVAANEVIQSSDYTSGLERRRLSVPFRNSVPSEKRRALIDFKATKAEGEFVEELPGLLNWALAMPDSEVTKLIRDTDRNVPSLAATKWQVMTETNPLADWLDNRLVYDIKAKTKVGIAERNKDAQKVGEYINYDLWLYPNYCNYVAVTGSKQISLKRFSSLLEELCQSQIKLTGVYKAREATGAYFVGLRLRTDNDTGFFPSPNKPTYTPNTNYKEHIATNEGFVRDSEGLVTPQVLYNDECEGYEGSLQNSIIQTDISSQEKHIYKVSSYPSQPSLDTQIHQNKEVNTLSKEKVIPHQPSHLSSQRVYGNSKLQNEGLMKDNDKFHQLLGDWTTKQNKKSSLAADEVLLAEARILHQSYLHKKSWASSDKEFLPAFEAVKAEVENFYNKYIAPSTIGIKVEIQDKRINN